MIMMRSCQKESGEDGSISVIPETPRHFEENVDVDGDSFVTKTFKDIGHAVTFKCIGFTKS